MIKLVIVTVILASVLVSLNGQSDSAASNANYTGILPRYQEDSNDCEKYKLYVKGQWREYTCPSWNKMASWPKFMKWDQTIMRCVVYNPAGARCTPRYKKIQTTTVLLPKQTIKSITNQVIDDSSTLEDCTTHGEYSVLEGTECKRYTLCEKGKQRVHACPEGLLYDNKYRSCVNPEDADCHSHKLETRKNDNSVNLLLAEESINEKLSSMQNKGNPFPSARQTKCPSINGTCKQIILCENLEPRKMGSKHQSTRFFNIIEKFSKQNEGRSEEPDDYKRHVPEDRRHVGSKVPILGSKPKKVSEAVGDFGFFTAVYESYNNHWTLRTSPEDWWFTVIRTVALAIDENAKKPAVRNFFVNHEGKKELRVNVAPGTLPHYIDYSNFFDQMANLINQNIKVAGYVDAIRSDFSTSTAMHKIISEITVMSSTQEFFDFTGGTFCGIPNVEMLGTLKDWQNLKKKVFDLKKILRRISRHIYLTDYYNRVGEVCDKLIETFTGSSINTTSEWWSHIFTKEERYGSGGGTYYNGWFIDKMLNLGSVRTFGAIPSGLVTVPMMLKENEHEENSTLVAGIAGIKMDDSGSIPIVQANHGWAMFVEPGSRYNT